MDPKASYSLTIPHNNAVQFRSLANSPCAIALARLEQQTLPENIPPIPELSEFVGAMLKIAGMRSPKPENKNLK